MMIVVMRHGAYPKTGARLCLNRENAVVLGRVEISLSIQKSVQFNFIVRKLHVAKLHQREVQSQNARVRHWYLRALLGLAHFASQCVLWPALFANARTGRAL